MSKANRLRFRQVSKNGRPTHYFAMDNHCGGDWCIGAPMGGVDFWHDPQQSTGLLDANGVEIFEGDVVDFSDTDVESGSGEVKYEKGRFYVAGFYYPCQDNPCDAFGENAKLVVIGNIHEHQERIKQETA
tara:strand:+ start:1931 stop:2320 length:390 start_codon:yes stop_codon:yes gene_type:complete